MSSGYLRKIIIPMKDKIGESELAQYRASNIEYTDKIQTLFDAEGNVIFEYDPAADNRIVAVLTLG